VAGETAYRIGNPLTAYALPFDGILYPAGNLWLSVTSLNPHSESTEIMRLTPDRTLIRYAALPGLIPHAFCNYVWPTDFAIGADGRLAITHFYSTENLVTPIGCVDLPDDRFGRLTPTTRSPRANDALTAAGTP